MATLVYQTTDTDFANRALDAFAEAGIPGHRIGRGYSDSSSYPGKGASEDQVCIYIERDTDSRRANDILLKLGAVRQQPLRLPVGWGVRIAFLVAGALVVWVAVMTLSR